MKVIRCSDKHAIKFAAKQLASGNVIGLPTDTVYGLACNANDPNAMKKLYEIKGREETKPVAICVANINDLKHWGEASHLSYDLLTLLLPGPVTIILKKSVFLSNPYLNPGTDKIGIRIPDFQFIRDLSAQFLYPIALTSANRSSEKSTLNIEEFKLLWPYLGAVFDGGSLSDNEQQREASTVVDLSVPKVYKLLRNGVAMDNTKMVLKSFGMFLEV